MRNITADGRRVCRKCGEAKPPGEFSPKVRGSEFLRSRCKVCERDDRREWELRNRPAERPRPQTLRFAGQRAQDWHREALDRVREQPEIPDAVLSKRLARTRVLRCAIGTLRMAGHHELAAVREAELDAILREIGAVA